MTEEAKTPPDLLQSKETRKLRDKIRELEGLCRGIPKRCDKDVSILTQLQLTMESWYHHGFVDGSNYELDKVEETIVERGWFADPTFRLRELRMRRRPEATTKEKGLRALNEMKGSIDPKLYDCIKEAIQES